jgi:predicted phage-related endonuclease
MNKIVKLDLIDLQTAMEDLIQQLPNMTMKTKIDVAARLRSVVKSCEAIDKAIKDEIKVIRNNEPGIVVGDLFKSTLAVIPTTRLDQKKLELEYPKAYAKCLETKDQIRISFEPR